MPSEEASRFLPPLLFSKESALYFTIFARGESMITKRKEFVVTPSSTPSHPRLPLLVVLYKECTSPLK